MALTTVGSLRGAASRGLAAALVLAAVLGGCSAGDGDDADDASTAGGGVVPIATLPPVETTVLVTTVPATTAVITVSVSTTVVATTELATTVLAVATTARPTTTVAAVPAVPCDINTVVAQTQTAYQGVTPTELRCAEGWAAWIGQPNDQLSDGYFAVASWNGSSWELVNLGTSFICTDAGVPDRLWDTLGCFE